MEKFYFVFNILVFGSNCVWNARSINNLNDVVLDTLFDNYSSKKRFVIFIMNYKMNPFN